MSTHDEVDEKLAEIEHYQSLNLQQRQVWDRQQRFLEAYAKLGKKSKAAEASGIPVDTVETWERRDTNGFTKRILQAHQSHVESWEQLMDDRLASPSGNRGSDVLLMFKLKAEAPQKYREEVKVVGIEASKQMMDRLRELAARDRQRAEQEGPAVEGVYEEVAPVGTNLARELPSPEPPVEPKRN
jgi:hypothetical protein